jgi:hypothetical protein
MNKIPFFHIPKEKQDEMIKFIIITSYITGKAINIAIEMYAKTQIMVKD